MSLCNMIICVYPQNLGMQTSSLCFSVFSNCLGYINLQCRQQGKTSKSILASYTVPDGGKKKKEEWEEKDEKGEEGRREREIGGHKEK